MQIDYLIHPPNHPLTHSRFLTHSHSHPQPHRFIEWTYFFEFFSIILSIFLFIFFLEVCLHFNFLCSRSTIAPLIYPQKFHQLIFIIDLRIMLLRFKQMNLRPSNKELSRLDLIILRNLIYFISYLICI